MIVKQKKIQSYLLDMTEDEKDTIIALVNEKVEQLGVDTPPDLLSLKTKLSVEEKIVYGKKTKE